MTVSQWSRGCEGTYLSSFPVPLPLVPLQVVFLQGEAAHAAAEGEEEDRERGRRGAEAPQGLEVPRVLGHPQGQV